MANPDRLRGHARRFVMRRYLAGRINAHEAADLIGVDPRSIARAAPGWFNWRLKRDQVIERMRLVAERIADAEANGMGTEPSAPKAQDAPAADIPR